MSPELIDSRHGLRGYDGMSVDVWAAGVLLVAMLLGTFPFEHLKWVLSHTVLPCNAF